MYSVQKSQTKGKCRGCGATADAGVLYKITTCGEEGRKKKTAKESYYLCGKCCGKTIESVSDAVNAAHDKWLAEILEGTKFDPIGPERRRRRLRTAESEAERTER